MKRDDDVLDIEQIENPRAICGPGGHSYLQLRRGGTRFLKMEPLALAKLQREVNHAAFLVQHDLADYPAYGEEFLRLMVEQAQEVLPLISILPDHARGQFVYVVQFPNDFPFACRIPMDLADEAAGRTIVRYKGITN